MKPVDVKSSTYKFKISDIVRISKYKNIFANGYTLNCSKEVFVNKKVKITVPWAYGINDFYSEEIVKLLNKKNCKKQIKKC